MLVLLEQVSLVSVLGQVPIYQNGLLQSEHNPWKSSLRQPVVSKILLKQRLPKPEKIIRPNSTSRAKNFGALKSALRRMKSVPCWKLITNAK
ncbi:MAG: hypothetical protein IPP59_20780 [Betaproteobacteria bacterium]|nr:hypothetical protein [Candidatus Dechloromonas phosphorivorans]